ncbi:conserved virulence factor C family protein [Fictibacillus phosphorivorans]|uniref:conserved virulence factor C family protein n=1 Tax=Fictibacillus phosphorivorans TaxID=1221500 RepID=UPI00203D0928|nr:conserved virulence factor C family protein [Fictibacillus phosphorivorans]MCM3718743.1 conserved virulence factor C family protein [Fictibacillus phosphorivorans]MCM3776366.1 conserved virulence factor C family protein [Fictibacillus phosphorivorans]
MKITGIEPTPSPNSMKINLDETLPGTERHNYTKDNAENAPEFIREILKVEGVKSIYHVADFMALDRNPRSKWEDILAGVRKVFGQEEEAAEEQSEEKEEEITEITVLIQIFRGLPMQIKLKTEKEEKRVGLPERFAKAALKAQDASDNLVMERQWEEQGVRYGTFEQVGNEVAEEISAVYPQERLDQLVEQAFSSNKGQDVEEETVSTSEVAEKLCDSDWQTRYAALERMNPTLDDVMVLKQALKDEKPSIRRLAVVYLGMIEDEAVLPLLYLALQDKNVSVRRTAGDALSDLGNPKAIPVMCDALSDKNKLVRWRAARFLFEVGDETAIPALKAAQDDPEFEVALQVKIALERIQSGEEAAGTVWQQMTKSREQ